MSKDLVCALLFCATGVTGLLAQGSASATLSPKPQTEAAEPAKEKKPDAVRPEKTGTTEVYADQVFFDTGKYIGVFTGHVIVNDARFNIQADKLTLYISKGPQQGVEKAVAEGNVGIVQDRPDPDGGPPKRAVGRAETVVYNAKDGNLEMTGTPRVQNGLNTHVATSPETVMILNEAGQLTTRGPSRTEIRQETKGETVKP